ncbi:MAG TPA: glycosyltransferase family 61 protein, partial [Segetibacter sp.]
MGLGIKSKIEKTVVSLVKKYVPEHLYKAPRKVISLEEYIKNSNEINLYPVYRSEHIKELPPIIENHHITKRFSKFFSRTSPQAYVTEIRGGYVYGDASNFIISPDNYIISDLSREFGAYGGVCPENFSLLTKKLMMPTPEYINGNVAVISTSGYNNFHHWNYDCIPRVELLKKSNLFDKIDWFVMYHSNQSFQLEAINLLGIPFDKIINHNGRNSCHIHAERLFVPSLPSPLGTVSPWVITFLNRLYQPKGKVKDTGKRLYLSRKKATSRRITNNNEFEVALQEN